MMLQATLKKTQKKHFLPGVTHPIVMVSKQYALQ